MDAKIQRIAVLDGLRALAIALVVLRHGIRPFWLDPAKPFWPAGPVDIGSVMLNGWMGVDLFFVLSGFLITAHLLERHVGAQGIHRIGDYFTRRFLRIAPAYYAVLAIACLGFFPFFPYPENHENLGWRALYHVLFMQDYWPSDIIVVFWSLAVEIKFYLAAPFIVYALCRARRPVWIYAALGFLIALQPLLRYMTALQGVPFSDFQTYFFDFRTTFHLSLDGLLAGMLCAFIVKDGKIWAALSRPRAAEGLFWAGLALVAVPAFSGPLLDIHVGMFDKTLLVTVLSAGFALMMLGLLGGCRARTVFEARCLKPVALVSYSLYLVHLPVLYLAWEVFEAVLPVERIPANLSFIPFLAIYLPLSYAAAWALYRLAEKPGMDLAMRLVQQKRRKAKEYKKSDNVGDRG